MWWLLGNSRSGDTCQQTSSAILSTVLSSGEQSPGPCLSLCSYLSAARTGSSTPVLTGPQPADSSTYVIVLWPLFIFKCLSQGSK